MVRTYEACGLVQGRQIFAGGAWMRGNLEEALIFTCSTSGFSETPAALTPSPVCLNFSSNSLKTGRVGEQAKPSAYSCPLPPSQAPGPSPMGCCWWQWYKQTNMVFLCRLPRLILPRRGGVTYRKKPTLKSRRDQTM